MTKRYFVVNKPYGMLSQFSQEGVHPTLGELMDFPKDVYPVGRLDRDSEGLLVLTNDKRLNHQLLNPAQGHFRTYWCQVEGLVKDEALEELINGVAIRIKGKNYITRPAEAATIFPDIEERDPPVRFRKNIPTSWMSLKLTEGKNRQVRRMTAAVGFPTLRLIRVQIGDLSLHNLKPGAVKEYSGKDLFRQLGI